MKPNNISTEVQEVIGELIFKLSSLSLDELNQRPETDAWSAAQVGEHLLKSYDTVKVLYGNTKETERQIDEKVETIKNLFLNFDRKFKNPDFITPSDGFIDKETLVNDLEESKNRLIEAAATLDMNLTCTDFALPTIGEFTRLEWIKFMIIHTQRHLHQLKNTIERVKAMAE